MKNNSNISLLQKLKKLSLLFSIFVAMVGFVVLVGWIGNIPILKSISPNWISMKADTAICFLLSGITLILLIRERPGRIRKILIPVLSLIIIFIGAISLLEYIFHFNAGIDQFFFKDDMVANGTASPGRPAAETSFCFILFGLSFLFGGITKSYPLIFQWLNIVAGFIALIGLLGFLFGVQQLSGISEYTSMAVHTSFTFLILMEASLLLHPDKGIMKLPSSNTVGGRLIRSSLPIIVALIIIMGWLHYQGELAGLYDTRLGIVILVLSIILVFTLVLFFNATSLSTTEKKLQQSETHLSTIFANSSVGLILLDTNCTILELNDRTKYFNSLSFGRQLMKGENLLLSIPGYRKEEFRNNFEKVLQGERINFESVYPQADGSIITFNVNLNPVNDAKGEIAGACLTFEDISERKKTEEKIKQLSQAVEQSPASVVITDTKGNIKYVNKKFSDVTGYAPEDVLGKNPRILKSGHTTAIDYGNLWKNISSGLEWRGEFYNKKKNGELYWEYAIISPIFDPAGKIINFLAVKEDITERKQVQEALLREQYLIQALMNNLPDNIYFKDNESRFLRINKSLGALFGLKDPADAIGKTDFDFFDNEHASKAYNDEQEIMQTGKTLFKDEKETWPDGSISYALTTKMPMRNAEGNIIGTFGVSRDITERKKAEEELLQSHKQFQNLVESISGVYWITDLDANRTIYVSPSYETIRGKKAEDLYNDQKDFINGVHPEDKEYVLETYKNIPARLKANITYRIIKPDGELRWISARSNVLIGTNGHKMEYGYAEDITEEKNAEVELKKAHDHIQLLLDSIAEGAYGVDKNGVCTFVNKSFLSLLGYSDANELIGKKIHPIIHHSHPDGTQYPDSECKMLNSRKTKQHINVSNEVFWRKDGVAIPVEYWSYPIIQDDKVLGAICTFIDISDRKKAEEEMIAMEQKMLDQKIQEQKNVAKAIIKAQERERNYMGQELHDNVNQILAGTKLYLGMIGTDDKTKEAIKFPMELIDNAIKEIRSISHKNVTPQTNVNLMDMLQSLINDLEKNTTLKTILRFSLNGAAKDDDLKLNIYRIIQEQVNNILKHAAAKNVSISLQAIDNSIRVITTDDGKGFDLNKTRKGIGISNMMNRIETFNGKMEIISSPGNGCKTIIEIPY